MHAACLPDVTSSQLQACMVKTVLSKHMQSSKQQTSPIAGDIINHHSSVSVSLA
jgi:hypothetical protein